MRTDLGQIITGGPGGPVADVGENPAHGEEGFLCRPQLQEGGAGTALWIIIWINSFREYADAAC